MRYVQGDLRASHLVSLLCYITESDKTSKFISYKNAAYFSKSHLSLPTSSAKTSVTIISTLKLKTIRFWSSRCFLLKIKEKITEMR